MIWSFFLVLTELVNFQPVGKIIYSQKFGQLDDDTPLINKFLNIIPSLEDYDSGTQIVGKIQYVYSGYDDLLFVIVADKTENVISIIEGLENLKVAFSKKFFSLIQEGKDDGSLFKPFQEDVNKALSTLVLFEQAPSEKIAAPAAVQSSTTIENSSKKQMIKIAFIGNKGVG
ncbi:MAG TPA: hypothetical protein VMV49_00005, partial [Candidatus Deferrimicrobium sp.]|nr:hypothetical protein [Candidatus Deferrimicrobium sp.]